MRNMKPSDSLATVWQKGSDWYDRKTTGDDFNSRMTSERDRIKKMRADRVAEQGPAKPPLEQALETVLKSREADRKYQGEEGKKEFEASVQPTVDKLNAVVTELVKINENISKLHMKKFEIEDHAMNRILNVSAKFGMSPTDQHKMRTQQAGSQVSRYEDLISKRGGVDKLTESELKDYQSLLDKQQGSELEGLSSNPFKRDGIHVDRNAVGKRLGANQSKQAQVEAALQKKADIQMDDEKLKQEVMQEKRLEQEKAVKKAIGDLTGMKDNPEGQKKLNELVARQQKRIELGLGPSVNFGKDAANVLGGDQVMGRDPKTGKAIMRSEQIQSAFDAKFDPNAELKEANKQIVDGMSELTNALLKNTEAMLTGGKVSKDGKSVTDKKVTVPGFWNTVQTIASVM
jgi:hypothetical protein